MDHEINVLSAGPIPWSTVLLDLFNMQRSMVHHEEKKRQAIRIYSGMILSFLTFSLTYPVSRPMVKWGVLIYYLLSPPPPPFLLSLFLSPSYTIASSLLHTHTRIHAAHAITHVPFHQMKTKAML